MSVISDLIDEKISVEEAACKALGDDETLAELLEVIVSKRDKIRFSSYHVLLHISEHNPDVLYPKWDYLADLLKSDNHYNRYIVINLLANLVKVDKENKFEACFDRYFDNIAGEKTVVAGQAALNPGKIAKAKPTLQAKITNILVNIAQIHQSKKTELMKADAIEALNDYFDKIADKAASYILDRVAERKGVIIVPEDPSTDMWKGYVLGMKSVEALFLQMAHDRRVSFETKGSYF